MIVSNNCLDLIRRFEGCRLIAYLDSAGIPTVGYGTTGPDIKLGTLWSQSQANFALVARCNAIASILDGCVVPVLNQNQFDALISLCYNIGQGAFRGSTLLRLVNTRQFEAAGDEFLKWDHVGGVVSPGLLARREAERALFLS